MIRDDGSLAWLIDGYVSAERYPYSEAYEGEKNYIRNSVKVAISAYSGEVEFYIVDEGDPVIQTYANMFPDLFTKEIPEDIQAHFRYPDVIFTIQAKIYNSNNIGKTTKINCREKFC